MAPKFNPLETVKAPASPTNQCVIL
ncbi:hypothetical protein TMatcc_002562 [Talaromyces marneffei ATCC 18224]|uniref:Uncharacterized protein n=1 Tax=Talaromyces marneffei PM1 TaxID=1077442 RepID=A0A093VFW6_TALMA